MRTLAFVATAFVSITLNFALFHSAPGDYATLFARIPNGSPGLQQQIRRQFGLDRSLWQQYVSYLGQLAHGNLGVSFANQEPVTHNLRRDLGNTIPMVLAGTIFAIVVGVATGAAAGWRRGGLLDHGLVAGALVFYSLPAQWLGLMLIILFGGVLPTGGMSDPFALNPSFWSHIADVARHMILPSLTLGLVIFGQYTLVMRSTMVETMGEDHVLTARAKGLRQRRIFGRHVFRNALLPTVSLVALSIGSLVTGALLVEIVFSWPGIGQDMYQSITSRDYPMLQGGFLLVILSVLTANYLADLAYARLDPRVTG
jgi:ABC-type dipeptide/oligopeptide/nickel transport system permease component